MGVKRPTASVCIALAVGRSHHTRRPSADEPRCVAVGHRAALRPPEALPFRRLAAPVEVEAAIPQKGHEIGFDRFADHGVVDDQTQVGGVAPHGGDSP